MTTPPSRNCRVVTTAQSADLLLRGQLSALADMNWTVVSGDEWAHPFDGVEAVRSPMRRELAASDVVAWWRLFRLFRRRRFTLVQTHTPKASLLGLPAARLSGATAVYTMHGALYFRGNSGRRNLLGRAFEMWCCAWAHVVLLQSREDLDVLPSARICPRRKLRYVGNGIDLDRFQREVPAAFDEPLPIVVMVSRLVVEKGCRDFFRLAERLAGQAVFVHVGPVETDQRDAVPAAEVDAVRRSGAVRFTGPVSDVRPYLRAADVVLLPSYREGIPRVAMEAAASGVPVVGYDIRGMREVLPPSMGLLAPVADVAGLEVLLRGLLTDADRRQATGEALRAHVTANFSEQEVVARLRQFYALASERTSTS